MRGHFHWFPILVVFPTTAMAQYTDPMSGEAGYNSTRPTTTIRSEPIITNVELRGPLPAAEFQGRFRLTEGQATEYRAVLDSFTAATRSDRDDALRRVEQLGTAITKRDSAAAEYYRDHLKVIGKALRAHQSRFDDRMKKLLSKDQQKEYRDYRKKQEEAARAGTDSRKP